MVFAAVRHTLVVVALSLTAGSGAGGARRAAPEDGYDLWLRYRRVASAPLLAEYRRSITQLIADDAAPRRRGARDELKAGLRGLLGADVPATRVVSRDGALVIGTPASSPVVARLSLERDLAPLGDEGFLIRAVSVG